MTMIRSRQPRISKLSRRSDMLYEIDRLRRDNKYKDEFYQRSLSTIKDLRSKLFLSHEKCKKLIARSSLSESAKEELAESMRDLQSEHDEYVATVDDLLEEATEKQELLKAKIYRLGTKLEKLHTENDKLSLQNRLLESNMKSVESLDAMRAYILGLDKLPRTIKDIVTMANELLGDKLVFSHEAWKHYKNYTLDQIDDSWYLIKSLPILYSLLLVDNDPNFRQEFKNETGLRFSVGETSYFKKDPSKIKQREFTFDDGKYVCMWHIGKQSHDYGSTMRCYFYPDQKICRIRVGYIGEHL